MKTNIFIVLVALFLLFFTLGVVTVIFSYNTLVRTERTIVENRGQIFKICQSRLDYLFKLIPFVELNAPEEKVVLATVKYIRDSATGALAMVARKKVLTGDQLTVVAATQETVNETVNDLNTLAERHPKLQKIPKFLALLDQFAGTDLHLSAAASKYNANVYLFNTRLRKFPGSVNASLFHFSPYEFYEAREGAEGAVYLRSMGAVGSGRSGRGPKRIEVTMEDPVVAWLIFLDVLGVILIFLFARNFVQKREVEILANYKDKPVLLVSHTAHFEGHESKGRWQFRGKGILILTETELYFELWFPSTTLVVPLLKIQKVEIAEFYLGKTSPAPLLKLIFTNEKNQLDSSAWRLRNVNVWKRHIEDLLKV